jgi:integrase
MRAYLTLAAFAGVRPEEITRLHWNNIDLSQSLLYIPKSVSKTRDDREVPLTQNCVAWLLTCSNRTGPIQPKSSLATRFLKIRTFCGIETWRKQGEPWPHDVLRHTFASSWLAVHKNRPLLAEIMGNSVGIIAKHYKRTIPLAQAQALFAIMPPHPSHGWE